jgi:DNA primase
MPSLGRGFKNAPTTPFFEASLLPDAIKLQLCQDLLSEIGAERVRAPNAKKEIIHSCPIPNAHRNGDRNPSASLNYERLAFNCLGCGAQGGLLWFIAVTRGVETDEAFRWLGDQTGVGGRSMDGKRVVEILEAIFAKQETRPEPVNFYPDSALTPWTFPVTHPYMTHMGSFGKIKCRGIPEENCQRFKIGYAENYPMGWARGEDGELLLDDDGKKVPLPPQERIIIPLYWEGRLLGWQARAIRPEDANPKYKNSVNFPRDRVLYGWPGPDQDIVLVESPMSVLRHCHHQPMVASFGKHLTEPQLRILHKARSITLWFDPDAPGWKGTQHAITELRRYVPLRVVDWKYRDTDPADLPDEVVDERVANAMPWSLWKWPGYESLKKWEG